MGSSHLGARFPRPPPVNRLAEDERTPSGNRLGMLDGMNPSHSRRYGTPLGGRAGGQGLAEVRSDLSSRDRGRESPDTLSAAACPVLGPSHLEDPVPVSLFSIAQLWPD
jgi:hypothetical protein